MTLLCLKQLVKVTVLPPTGPLLIAIAGLALAGRHPLRGRMIASVGVFLVLLLSMPATSAFLVRCLDRSPPFEISRATDAQAIVILGGGTRPYAAEYGGATLGSITLERVRYGARLARASGLPILVSGGSLRGAPPEALLMRNVLTHEYGVPVRWMEMRSRNTHENAVRSAALLKAGGVGKVILVGHSFDFPRTRNEFEAAGISVIAAPISIPPAIPTEVGDFLPGAGGLQQSYYALYEILANIAFHFTTRQSSAPARATSPGIHSPSY